MSILRSGHLARWWLLYWIGLIYLWSVLSYLGASVADVCHRVSATTHFCYTTFLPALNSSSFILSPGPNLPALITFTLCLVLCGFLNRVILTRKIAGHFSWLVCFLQGILVLTAKLVIQGDDGLFGDSLALVLYAALCLQSITIFRQWRPVLMMAGIYLILFIFSASIAGDWQYTWQNLPYTGYIALLPLLILLVIFYLVQLRSHGQLTTAHQQLGAAYQQLAVSAQHIETLTLLMERQRIARELHDTLAQHLVGLIRQLDVAEAHLKLQHNERALTVVQETSKSARTALNEARWAIDNLRTTTTSAECVEAVLAEVAHFQDATGIPCAAELATLSMLPPTFCEQVQRIISEALTNIARHARARHVWVHAHTRNAILEIEIGDDGIGFDVPATQKLNGHFGLLGLHERARLLGGTLAISSTPGAGTSILVSLSAQKMEQAALERTA